MKETIPIMGYMPIAQGLTAKLYNILVAKGIITEEEALAEYLKDCAQHKDWV